MDDETPLPNYVFVDVEDKRNCVKVYDHDGNISRQFVSSAEHRMDGERNIRIVDDPYAAACTYAKVQAAKLKCDWCANA